jgi:crotonobetainyl-CoA:carnitine CoA-transferase CaiB-like acyl-CoA transferase
MPASREAVSGGPLDGIRVLDLSSVVMGPLATQILGDLGADVITVENRDGDINRIMGPGPHPGLSGVSLNLLRNKRNISLDISHPDGRVALLRAAGHDELVGDPRLSSRALWLEPGFGYATLSRVLAKKTTVQWLAFCADAGIPAAAATGLDELIDALPDGEHPDAGWYKVIPPPARFSATPAAVRRPAPLAGQHTREVLREAGLTEEEITRLAEAGVLTPDRAGPGRRAPAG